MLKFSRNSLLICAVLPIGLLGTGCGYLGSSGYHEVVAGNWPAAKAEFEQDYKDFPAHPVAQFNIGTAYHHDGNVEQADKMFSEAVISGKTYYPSSSLEPEGTSATVGRHACTRLHRDNKLDINCGDQIAQALPPAPPPPAPPAPEPPPPPPPKQGRN